MAKQKKIAILVKSAAAKKFLDTFFSNRKKYSPMFLAGTAEFHARAAEKTPSALICDTAFLPFVSGTTDTVPTLVIIVGDTAAGISQADKSNADAYLYKPFMEIDLEHKLKAAIAKKEMMLAVETEMRELEAVVDLTQVIADTREPQELLFKIVSKIAEIIPVTRCSIIRVDPSRRSAYVISSFEDPLFSGVKLSLAKYPEIVQAMKSRKPVVVRDVARDPVMKKVRRTVVPLSIRSILVLPVFLREKIIGTLFLRTSRAGYSFSENEIRLLDALANASAGALNNAFFLEQVEDEKTRLEKLSITDYLTGIYNVRYFCHRIAEEFSRGIRYSLPISCLMIDIDHFKKINDLYGHKTGDLVLREFAHLLNRHSRRSDVLARYGGEEFIILLPQTSSEGGLAEAERIRALVKQHKFKNLKNERGLTVSIGLATHPHRKIKTHDDLITLADDALFRAKHQGRDRIAVYGR